MSTLTGWPFWAPSDLAAVEHALDLAHVVATDHVVDLGCGDGQVLVAAARRGCRVTGIECDPELAEQARTSLRSNGLDGEVVVGDVFDYALDQADVIFTYLAPATLQRLRSRFQQSAGARLVTVDFEVPGLVADVVDGTNHLYRLPASMMRRARPGWRTDGVLVAVTPERHSLTCLSLAHRGGDVVVEPAGDVSTWLTVATGTDHVRRGEVVAVDLRWDELSPGAFASGALRCAGEDDLAVFALVTEESEGVWEVTAEGVDRVQRRVSADWAPATFAELVAACDESDDADG